MKKIFFPLTLLVTLLVLLSCSSKGDELSRQFRQLPDSQRMAVYWYWMSDNISVEGVQHDLEAMKKVGITRAYIGNIWQDDVPAGDIKVLSPEWWEVMHAALKRATELGIEIGVFNCPGWSQSGGPWVKSSQAMRYLASTQTTLTGDGTEQHVVLPSPGDEAQDVRVLAYPAPKEGKEKSVTLHKTAGYDLTTDITLDPAFTARSLTIQTDGYLLINMIIQVQKNGGYETLKVEHLDRTNDALNVGFHPHAPICIALPDVKGKALRLISTGGPRDCDYTVTVSDRPAMERYEEKSLGKMFQSPLPMWDEYMWATQPEAEGYLCIQPDEVTDLTDRMAADGTLTWTVPDGTWTVLRTAMVPTGVTNSPASREATGYEVDKMSREHVAAHFDAFLGELMRRIPEADRRSFRIVVEDSYETGGQNWTDDMIDSFTERYGYDPTPFLPTMYGQVIGSQDQSERFLWDLRRLIADRVAYDYVGGLREVSHQHGLTTWLECYGHWGFPSEFLMYGGQSDEVAGEFWSEGSLGDIENRAASSCAHIYGKQKVWAESCTAGGPNYSRYPATMKQRTDRFFCEGINATLLHLFIQQPDDTTLPGISAPFGNDFQRKNTWFSQIDLFTDYLRRCNLMLQQGSYVADVAYFIGEDAPKMTGECSPALPRGYSFDYLNAEVLKDATVTDGALTLASGMQYRLLVLPRQTTMRPEVLEAIERLTREGLNVVGPRPETSPSMQDYPAADDKVRTLAAAMWNGATYGKGRVWADGTDLQTIVDELGIAPDCYVDPSKPIAFIHRRTETRDIWFVSNQSDASQTFDATFRTADAAIECWDPTDASQRDLTAYAVVDGRTQVPMMLAPNQSLFIVFDHTRKPQPSTGRNFGDEEVWMSLDTPWTVDFDSDFRGPAEPVTFETLASWTANDNPAIRYYSGTATYSQTFELPETPKSPVYLDLGRVMVMAKVYVNGKYAGGAWTYPYRVETGRLLKKGTNTIRVEVVNNWQNRLIGDQQLPEAERPTWTSVNPWHAGSTLQESGLLGPVVLLHPATASR